jgi:hypothetical protein
MSAAGVEFVTAVRSEPYGQVAVFRDVAGWDLVGPAATDQNRSVHAAVSDDQAVT